MNLRANIFALILMGFSSSIFAAPDSDKNAARPAVSRELAEDAVVGDVLLQAMSLMGIAYRFGGTNPNTGFDCSGFIRYIFQRSIGVNLPRTAAEQAKIGRSVERSELKPGDILFFNTRGFANSHNGLYLGNGRFVHAPRTGKNIEIANLGSSYWATRYNGARRVTRSNAYAGNLRDEVVSRKKIEVAASSVENNSPRRSIKNVDDPLENLAQSSSGEKTSDIVANSATLGAAGVLASGAAVALLADASSRLKTREKERAQALKALRKPRVKVDKNDAEPEKKSKNKRKDRSSSQSKKSNSSSKKSSKNSESSFKKSSSSKKSKESKKTSAGKGKKS